MDKNQKIAAMNAIEDKIIEELGRTKAEDVGQFACLLDNLGRVDYFLNQLTDDSPSVIIGPTVTPTSIAGKRRRSKSDLAQEKPAEPEAPAPVEEPAPAEEAPATEPEPTPEPEPAPAAEIKPCPKPEPRLTKAEVRTQLSAYANSGADVAVLMQGMGYTRLSDVPESRYAELLELAKKAVQ